MDTSSDESPAGNPPAKLMLLGEQPTIGQSVGDWFVERGKYTPLRLTMEERKLLRLLEAALGLPLYFFTFSVL